MTPRSVWTATNETKKDLPEELEIDEFTEEDLKKILEPEIDEKIIERYTNNHDKNLIR